MADLKEQMNVQVSAETRRLAKICAAAHQKSLNSWVELAIREKVARDKKELNLDAITKDLERVARRYLPGKVATVEQMLAMARRVAKEDTEEGFTVEHFTEPAAARRKRPRVSRAHGR